MTRPAPLVGGQHRWRPLSGRPGERSKRCAVCGVTWVRYRGTSVFVREPVVHGARRAPLFITQSNQIAAKCGDGKPR